AAAHGLPVVSTSLIARQLAWSDDLELLTADTPDGFANCCESLYSDEALWQRLRQNALRCVELDYAPEVLREALSKALDVPVPPNARLFRWPRGHRTRFLCRLCSRTFSRTSVTSS